MRWRRGRREHSTAGFMTKGECGVDVEALPANLEPFGPDSFD